MLPRLATLLACLFAQQLSGLKDRFPEVIEDIRGKGLLIGLKLEDKYALALSSISLPTPWPGAAPPNRWITARSCWKPGRNKN